MTKSQWAYKLQKYIQLSGPPKCCQGLWGFFFVAPTKTAAVFEIFEGFVELFELKPRWTHITETS